VVEARKLNSAERQLAATVYHDTLPFDRIYITNLDLDAPVTLAGVNLSNRKFDYTINWVDAFGDILSDAGRRATFIHELCHVWQGEHGLWPTFYMGQSAVAQLKHGIGDLLDKREWRGWGNHRSTTYKFPAASIGNRWSSFNVEQQASIVESWFMPESDRITRAGPGRVLIHNFGPGVYGGGRSPHDPRFPYVRDVIRARNRGASYRAGALPPGSDPQIKAIQDKLVALCYLDAMHADGLIGRRHSATLDAVAEFQHRHGLSVDRDIGGPNSETRRKLALPIERLVRKQ
jgi:hypothetical protein